MSGLTSLTPWQKLEALAFRFYHRQKWQPKPGDYYTSSRADLELYQVVDVRDGKVFTRYLTPNSSTAEWPEDEFLAEHTFGYARVHVPPHILALNPHPRETRPDPLTLEPAFRAYAEEEISIGKARECARQWAAGEAVTLPPPR